MHNSEARANKKKIIFLWINNVDKKIIIKSLNIFMGKSFYPDFFAVCVVCKSRKLFLKKKK